MELRVKDILKAKGMKMKDLADKLGMHQSNLMKSLSRNPTLQTLEDVASALHVRIDELFPSTSLPAATNLLLMNGRTYGVMEMDNIVQVPFYSDNVQLQKDIKKFVNQSFTGAGCESMCGFFESRELFCLTHDAINHSFTLTLCYANSQLLTIRYDELEFSNNGKCDIGSLCQTIIYDVMDAASLELSKKESRQ